LLKFILAICLKFSPTSRTRSNLFQARYAMPTRSNVSYHANLDGIPPRAVSIFEGLRKFYPGKHRHTTPNCRGATPYY